MEPLSTGKSASNAMSGVHHLWLVYFMKAIEKNEFCAHINIGRLYVKQFVKWIISSTKIPAKKIPNEMRA